MTISANKVISLSYILTDDEGDVLDHTEGTEALDYLHGAHNIIPGLEQALEGMRVGDEKSVRVSPAEGYGEFLDELVWDVPRTQFPDDMELELGMPIEARDPNGEEALIFMITEIGDESVTLNGNHPLAGEHLNFAVKIAAIREATSEEMAQGHPN